MANDTEIDMGRLVKLLAASREMLRAGRSYMNYHTDKFYGDSNPAPTGITPALNVLSKAIDAYAVLPAMSDPPHKGYADGE